MEAQLLDELNVRELVAVEDESDFLRYEVRPNLPVLGPKYGKEMGKVREAIAKLDAAAVVKAEGTVIKAGAYELEPEELLVSTVEQEGYASAEEGGYIVLVDTEVPPELRDEGLARELVHRIQNMRRDAAFDISDRIASYWQGDDDVSRVLAAHGDYVRGETLSLELVEGEPPADAHREELTVEGHDVVLGVVRATS